jgi:hypothetical protein
MLYVLPDSAGDILVVQATEILTQDDYQDIFLEQIKKQLKVGHKLRVLLYLDHALTDIESESNWQSSLFFSQCEAQIARVAVVGSSDWQAWAQTFSSDIVKHFKVTEFLTALHWADEADI